MARTGGQTGSPPARRAGRRSTRRSSTSEATSPAGPADRGDSAAPGAAAEISGPPAWLMRSAVFKKMPASERVRLESAILLRPAGCETLEAIARRFELKSRYGLSLAALRSYARQLEQWLRPAVASQVMAGVLGCLPEDFRRRLIDGSQVLLLSRVNQALSDEDGPPLSVAELAKLADVLKNLARHRTGSADNPSSDDPGPDETAPDFETMAKTVRNLYGIGWPLDTKT